MTGFQVQVDNTTNRYVFDIEVEDNHNFLADHIFVHNCGFFVAKKKYVLRVLDLEGTKFTKEDPYIKIMGLETITGGVAPFSKKYLKQSIPMILDKTEDEIINWVKTLREEFIKTSLIQIAKTQGISKLQDPAWGTVKNGRKVSPPSGSKAGICTNRYINENNLAEEYPLIEAGSKSKFLYLMPNNPLKNDRFAFLSNKFAENFREYIDYDTNWEKYFMKPLRNMTEPIGYNIDRKTEELDEW